MTRKLDGRSSGSLPSRPDTGYGEARQTMDVPMLNVLLTTPSPGPTTNPYITQLAESLPSCVRVRHFSMRAALFSKYDLLHVHWPEEVYRRKTAGSVLLTRALVTILLLRIACARIPVVRTMHNISPHDGLGRSERLIERLMDALTSWWIRINLSTPSPEATTDTILHGHYRDWAAGLPKREAVPGRLLFFGLVRRYKGVEDLLQSFRALDDPSLTLHLAGQPVDPPLAARISLAVQSCPRIHAMLRHLDDAELTTEITEAEIVVLPYTNMHNSGALLLALSLDRPVIAPWTDSNVAIRDEVGAEWIQLFKGPLDHKKLRGLIDAMRMTRRALPPDLSKRNWDNAGRRHYEAYLKAISRRKLGAPVSFHGLGN
jgi:beta-1,4-mannosyltransferase